MIKLNLLPQYVAEARRIWIVIITFLVLFAFVGGGTYLGYTGLVAQEGWFGKDQKYFEERTEMIKKEKQATDALKSKAGIYDPYIKFFSREEVLEHNKSIAETLDEAAKTIVGDPMATPPWFNTMTVSKEGEVEVEGQIRGLMNFLDYYFKMKDKSFAIAPAAIPAPSPNRPTMEQLVALKVTGTLTKKFAAPPTAPGEVLTPENLYTPAGGTPAAGGTSGAGRGGPGAGGGPAPGRPGAGGGPGAGEVFEDGYLPPRPPQ